MRNEYADVASGGYRQLSINFSKSAIIFANKSKFNWTCFSRGASASLLLDIVMTMINQSHCALRADQKKIPRRAILHYANANKKPKLSSDQRIHPELNGATIIE